MTSLTMEVAKAAGVKPRDAERSKNFFALGLVSWLYSRPVEPHPGVDREALRQRPPWCSTPTPGPSRPGYNFGETAELFEVNYQVRPAALEPGIYTNITGNTALAWGLIAAAHQANLPLFLGSYPITPASDILHELSKHKHFGVRTLQAEDEIAGVGAAIGAAFGGSLGVTTTSGPGHRPQVGVDRHGRQPRAAPRSSSTSSAAAPRRACPPRPSSPTSSTPCTAATARRPCPSWPPMTPSHCFDAAIEAARIAVKYRTPVILLSDGYLANGAEPWRLPDVGHPARPQRRRSPPRPTTPTTTAPRSFWPYVRDEETLARPWAVPGTPGPRAPHRRPREGRTAPATSPTTRPTTSAWSTSAPPRWPASPRTSRSLEVDDPDGIGGAPVLVLGWGSTYGAIAAGVRRVRARGLSVAHAHLVHLNPFPSEPRRRAARLRQGARPRGEPGPAGQAGAGRLPRRRPDAHQGPGRALPGGGDRGGRPRDARRRPPATTADEEDVAS